MDHSSELEPECLLPPQSPGEESNEQIDEMLESIMRSLNYLPNLNTNCKKSQVDLGAASTFHEVPATENDVGPTVQSADVAAAEGVSYQTLETPGDQSDTDTGRYHFHKPFDVLTLVLCFNLGLISDLFVETGCLC